MPHDLTIHSRRRKPAMEPMTIPAMAPPLRLLLEADSSVVSGVEVIVVTTWREARMARRGEGRVLVGGRKSDGWRFVRPAARAERVFEIGVIGAMVLRLCLFWMVVYVV